MQTTDAVMNNGSNFQRRWSIKKLELTLSLRSTQALLTTVILSLIMGSSGSYGYNRKEHDKIHDKNSLNQKI